MVHGASEPALRGSGSAQPVVPSQAVLKDSLIGQVRKHHVTFKLLAESLRDLDGALVHYVRSGDFIEALLRESRDIDEYAFALGALAHHADDNTGHPAATNRAVPIVFPKLQRKFGDTSPTSRRRNNM